MTGADPGPQAGVAPAPAPIPVALEGSSQLGGPARPAPAADVVPPGSPRRRWVRVLRLVALVIALPIVAFAMGLLVAWIVHLTRGSDTGSRAGSPVTGQSPSLAPTRSASASASSQAVAVPADWVTEITPPAGLTFRHPPGWVRRTSLPEVLRFAPVVPGSTAPGIEGVGAGLETTADPAQAVRDFATRAYGGQPGFAATPASAVAAAEAGRHPGEQEVVVTYRRSGVDVRVVVHGFRSGTRTVLVLGRAAREQRARAAQLEAFVEASLRIS
jgi:hypothetical protein